MVDQNEIIDTYLDKQKGKWFIWQINGLLKDIGIDKKFDIPFWWWDKIKEYIDLYLNNESQSNKNNSSLNSINEQIWWLKWSVQLTLLETQLSITCPYFSELKELLDILKDKKIEFNKLKNNIEKWLEFDAIEWDVNLRKEKTKEKLNYSWYKNLAILNDKYLNIIQEDIDYVNEHSKYIVDNLTIKWELAQIKDIKDKDWNLVLDCTWSTPFINKQAAEDLIWFSLLFYKKTWRTFEISSAYRTTEHQEDLLRKNAKKWYTNPQGKKTYWVPTAQPWYSGHNLWYSIDIKNPAGASSKIWWVSGLQKIAKMFDFYPISSEDWHFDHKIFVDNYYNNKEARPLIAENIENSFNSSWAA